MAVPPDPVLDAGIALWRSKALLAALELGLFTALADGPLSAEQLRRRLGLHPRAMPDLADALLGMGLLERSGHGADATYANTAAAAASLDRREPGYLGHWLAWADARSSAAWCGLADALRAGGPAPRHAGSGTAAIEAQAAMEAMDALAAPALQALAAMLDLRPFTTLLDLGGDGGLRACTLAAQHRHLRGRTLDRPTPTRQASGRIGRAGLGARLVAEVAEPLSDPWPAADLITMGPLLAEQGLDGKQALLAKAYQALPAAGALLVVDHLIDDARCGSGLALLMSLNRLLSVGRGFQYSATDCMGWARSAGFARCVHLPLPGPLGAVMAWKAA